MASEGGPRQSDLEQAIQQQHSADSVLALLEASEEVPSGAAAAALHMLSRLSKGGGGPSGGSARAALAAHPALPRLFRSLQQGAEQLPVRSVVSALACCRELGLRPPRPLTAELAEQLIRRLPAVAPAQACNALRDLTKLGSGDARDSLLAAVDALVQAQQRELAAAAGGQQGRQQQQQGEAIAPWLAQLTLAQLTGLLWVCGKAAFRSQPLLRGITLAMLASGGGGQQQQPSMSATLELGSGQRPAPPASPDSWAPGAAGAAAGRSMVAQLGPIQLSSVFYSLGSLRWSPSAEVRLPQCAPPRSPMPLRCTRAGGQAACFATRRLP